MANISASFSDFSSTAASNQPDQADSATVGADLRQLTATLKSVLEPLSTVAGTNTITAACAGLTAYYSGAYEFVPANTNTGATTLNINSIGAKNIFWNGAACVGGELRANIPVRVVYDGTQFHVIASGFNGAFLDTHAVVEGSADSTKKLRFEVDGLTTAKTRVVTAPDCNVTLGFPNGHLFGCTLSNNGSDATNDIDITAGQCKDSTGAIDITCAAMTKQLDAGWAPGSAAGFRNSGVAIANTTYHVYAVSKEDGTQDYYAHTSTTVSTVITALQAESGGSAYLYARRIGSIIRTAGSILAFVQDGDHFQLSTPALDINVNSAGTSAVTRTLASIPVGINVRSILHVQVRSDASNDAVYLSDLATTDLAASVNGTGGAPQVGAINSSGSNDGYGEVVVRTNTSAQIRTRNLVGADANDILRIVTVGWYDNRGRTS